MKKVLTLAMVLLLCLALLPAPAMASEEPTIRVGEATGYTGETVDVTISLENNPGLVSMALEVTYDQNAMTLTKVTDASVLGTKNHNPDLALDPYLLSWENDTAAADFVVDGTIVTLSFELTGAPGTYPVTVSYDGDAGILNYNMSLVPFTVSTGKVDILNSVVPVSGVTLDHTTLSLLKGQSATLNATVSPADATDQTVSWSSSDETVATVADGVVTALKTGTAVITASAGNGTFTAACTVYVAEDTSGGTSAPLRLELTYAQETGIVTASVIVTDAISISNYDLCFEWDTSAFTLEEISNGQPTRFPVFDGYEKTGLVSAASNQDDQAVAAGDVLAVFALQAEKTVERGEFSFTVTVVDVGVSDPEAPAIPWNGATVTGTLTVSKLSEDSFDNLTNENAKINYTGTEDYDFTVNCEKACAVLCGNETEGYSALLALPAGDNTYGFVLPADYDKSDDRLLVAMKGDMNRNGVLESTDALLILRCAVGRDAVTSLDLLLCDINRDGRFTSTDVLQLLRLIVGLRTLDW